MSKRITGFVTEYDEYGRLRVTYPRIRDGADRLNTEMQLKKYAKKQTGWSPLSACSYLAKPTSSCFVYRLGRRAQLGDLVACNVDMEVEFVRYDKGWYIQVHSCNVCNIIS